MDKIKVAILGATGHIAKNIIVGLNMSDKYQLYLFVRNKEILTEFIHTELSNLDEISIHQFNDFAHAKYDVVINCVGIGDPAKLKKVGGAIFRLTEEFDNLVIDYLESNRDTLYINFSSGVAYGSNYNTPADQNKSAVIDINHISPTDYYTISKINTEAKHRSLSHFNIVDLRVFGFFSKYADLKSPYFLNDIVNSLRDGKQFVTGSGDMLRDFIHPDDLMQMIERCIFIRSLNDVFDVYSLEPISKLKIIDFFKNEYNLSVNIVNDTVITSVTGLKSNYYSLNKKSDMIGYTPRYTSLQAIASQLQHLITK